MKRRKRKKAHTPGILTQVTSLFGKWNSGINHQTQREPSSGRTEGRSLTTGQGKCLRTSTEAPKGPVRQDGQERRTFVLISVRTERIRSSDSHPRPVSRASHPRQGDTSQRGPRTERGLTRHSRRTGSRPGRCLLPDRPCDQPCDRPGGAESGERSGPPPGCTYLSLDDISSVKNIYKHK